MAAMSNYLENALINAVLRNTSYTSPSTVYVALYTDNPGEGGTGTEVSGGSYARVAATFGAPSNGVALNSGAIEFAQATASWGTITHAAIYDASTSGNMLLYAQLTTSKAIDSGDVFKFAVGELSITFA